MDLRSTIGAVARLPFDSDKLVDILCENEPAANNPDDPDHNTFWLVIADQFAKRAMVCDHARDKALAIIDSGSDIAMLGKLGMSSPDLTKRQKVLAEVRVRLIAPPTGGRSRAVLRKAQPLLMDIGDVFVYPAFGGLCINPYYASKEQDNKHWSKDGPMAWKQDGWSAVVIVDRGRAFNFFSWYRPLTISAATAHKPTLASLHGEVLWKLDRAGTCSALHFKRLELEKLGTLKVDLEKLRRIFPDMKPGTFAAVHEISIAEGLNVGPARKVPMPGAETPLDARWGTSYSTILGIEQILSD